MIQQGRAKGAYGLHPAPFPAGTMLSSLNSSVAPWTQFKAHESTVSLCWYWMMPALGQIVGGREFVGEFRAIPGGSLLSAAAWISLLVTLCATKGALLDLPGSGNGENQLPTNLCEGGAGCSFATQYCRSRLTLCMLGKAFLKAPAMARSEMPCAWGQPGYGAALRCEGCAGGPLLLTLSPWPSLPCCVYHVHLSLEWLSWLE